MDLYRSSRRPTQSALAKNVFPAFSARQHICRARYMLSPVRLSVRPCVGHMWISLKGIIIRIFLLYTDVTCINWYLPISRTCMSHQISHICYQKATDLLFMNFACFTKNCERKKEIFLSIVIVDTVTQKGAKSSIISG